MRCSPAQGAQPRAERREVAVDLREDWPRALRDNGFDAAKPSAWIAEGLLIYLPAAAEEQLFTGIDSMSCPGSHVAVEDGAPLAQDEYEARLEEERSSPGQRAFFQLVYNERHAPATEWFGNRGWTAIGTPLADYLRESAVRTRTRIQSGRRSPVTPWSAPSRNDRPLTAGTFGTFPG